LTPRSPPGGLIRGDGGQALLHVATVRFQMNLGQRIQQRFPGARQVAVGFEVISRSLSTGLFISPAPRVLLVRNGRAGELPDKDLAGC